MDVSTVKQWVMHSSDVTVMYMTSHFLHSCMLTKGIVLVNCWRECITNDVNYVTRQSFAAENLLFPNDSFVDSVTEFKQFVISIVLFIVLKLTWSKSLFLFYRKKSKSMMIQTTAPKGKQILYIQSRIFSMPLTIMVMVAVSLKVNIGHSLIEHLVLTTVG